MIYIVNYIRGGYYVEVHSTYHHTEEEAKSAFEKQKSFVGKSSVGIDPSLIELVQLDTTTLEEVTIYHWFNMLTEDDLDERGDTEDDGEE